MKLSKGSGDWVRFDKDTSSQYALCCWVAKNLTGPQIEFSTQAPEAHAGSAHRHLSMITSSTHAEAVASLSLMSSSTSGIDLNLGAGVSTGAGLKDDSVSVKLLGCGVVVGRKIGISLFDNSIGELAPTTIRHPTGPYPSLPRLRQSLTWVRLQRGPARSPTCEVSDIDQDRRRQARLLLFTFWRYGIQARPRPGGLRPGRRGRACMCASGHTLVHAAWHCDGCVRGVCHARHI